MEQNGNTAMAVSSAAATSDGDGEQRIHGSTSASTTQPQQQQQQQAEDGTSPPPTPTGVDVGDTTPPGFIGPLRGHLHPPIGAGSSPPAKRFKPGDGGETAVVVDPESSDGASRHTGTGGATSTTVASSNPVTPVILTEFSIEESGDGAGGGGAAAAGAGASNGSRDSNNHGDTQFTQPLKPPAATAAAAAAAVSSIDNGPPRSSREENNDDQEEDELNNESDENPKEHSSSPPMEGGDDGGGATTPTAQQRLIASKVPTTPMTMVERRQSSGGSTSPSDLSSSSRGDVAGRDGTAGGSISPLTATYFLPEVPPAPPSTPASESCFTPASISGSGRFAGLTAAATPLPLYAPDAVQNAYLLEQQQLLAEGAVTPAPTITRRGPSSHRSDEQQQYPPPTARDPPPEPPTPQPTGSGGDGGGAGAASRGETGAARPPSNTTTPLSDDFSEWAVSDRYQLLRILGRGSYGEVAQALDLSQGRPDAYVAIKRIQSPFDQEVDAVRLFREIHILRRLRGHECIIQLLDVVQPPSDDLDDFHDLYLVFEYVDTDLYKLIMSPQYLTTEHIQTFLYQMLAGLRYLHSSCVIHRDLKPANILLNEDCSLKICDFGLARIVDSSSMMSSQHNEEDEKAGKDTRAPRNFSSVRKAPLTRQLTKHVVTRWYRAPELILIQPYTSAVDIWSLGCILAELLSMQEGSVPGYQDRTPLFPGGTCYPLSGEGGNIKNDERLDQLSVIFGVIGTPSPEDIAAIGKANEYIKTLGKIQSKPLESLYPTADPAALDLLKQMLKFNPRRRCTAEEALEHDFFKNVRRKEMERTADKPLIGPDFLDALEIDLETLKRRTYEEVLWYRDQEPAPATTTKN